VINRKNKRRAPEVATQPESQTGTDAPETETGPDGLSAAAGEMRQRSEQLLADAAQDRTEAEAAMSAARDEVARLLRDAEARARSLNAAAGAAERESTGLAERATWLDNAIAEQAHAGEADQRATALETEREQLAGQAGDLDGRLERLQAQRQELAAQLATAREGADVDAVTRLRNQAASLDEMIASAEGLRTAAQGRCEQIGDGDGPGELAEARAAAAGRRAAVERIVDQVFPGSPGAVRRREAAELVAIIEANAERIRAEAGRKPPTPQRVVRL
jgi:hypothetical protein